MRKNILKLLSALVLLFLFGCRSTQTTSDNQSLAASSNVDKVENIQVKTVNPTKSIGNVEEFPLPNCGGTGKLTQSLGNQVSVSKTVEMGITVTVKGGGKVEIPEVAKISLEAAIEAAYKQEYETANSRLDTISMEAAPRTYVIYTINWEKQEFSSIVTSEFNRELIQTPYTFTMNVPKIAGSREEICPDIGTAIPPTPISQIESNVDSSIQTPVSQEGPFRSHYQVVVGDGIFEQGTFSDGLAEYTDTWLGENGHSKIQRLRLEEFPSGCDISRYNANLVWISGSAGMEFTINDEVVGTYK